MTFLFTLGLGMPGMRSLEQFCTELKAGFPVVSAKADKEYLIMRGDLGGEFYPYAWFEALAGVLNVEMNQGARPEEYSALFSIINSAFLNGDEDIKGSIDVAFVENLFWRVSLDAVRLHWPALPKDLKDLYFKFHRRNPI